MKMFAAGCVVAVLGTVAVQFASSATSTRTSGIPARVKALESKVKKLTTSVNALKLQSACLGVQGVTQFGNPAAGQGYVYTNDGGATLAITTGFDAPASGQAPSFYAATVNAACITSRAFKLGHGVTAHRTAALQAP